MYHLTTLLIVNLAIQNYQCTPIHNNNSVDDPKTSSTNATFVSNMNIGQNPINLKEDTSNIPVSNVISSNYNKGTIEDVQNEAEVVDLPKIIVPESPNSNIKDIRNEVPIHESPNEVGDNNVTELQSNGFPVKDNSTNGTDLGNPNISQIPNYINKTMITDSKNKLINLQANLQLLLANNVFDTLKFDKGKYLLPNLLEMFDSTFVRPVKDTIEKLHFELSPEYNNFGSLQEAGPPLFFQKLNEKKRNILGFFGVGNYDYPYAYRNINNE